LIRGVRHTGTILEGAHGLFPPPVPPFSQFHFYANHTGLGRELCLLRFDHEIHFGAVACSIEIDGPVLVVDVLENTNLMIHEGLQSSALPETAYRIEEQSCCSPGNAGVKPVELGMSLFSDFDISSANMQVLFTIEIEDCKEPLSKHGSMNEVQLGIAGGASDQIVRAGGVSPCRPFNMTRL
jgi:hypothetical protein